MVDVINNYVTMINSMDSTMLSNKLCLCLEQFLIIYSDYLKEMKDEVEGFLAKRRVVLHYDDHIMDPEERASLEIQFNSVLNQIEKSGSIASAYQLIEREKCYEEQFFFFSKLFPYFFKKAFEVCYETPSRLPNLFEESFRLLNKILFQTEYLISTQKNGIHETLSFYLIKEKVIIQNFPETYNPIALVINEVLIRPCLSECQEKA